MTIFQAALFAIEQLFEKEYKPVPIFVSNHENKFVEILMIILQTGMYTFHWHIQLLISNVLFQWKYEV